MRFSRFSQPFLFVLMLLWLLPTALLASGNPAASSRESIRQNDEIVNRTLDYNFPPPELSVEPNALESHLNTGETEEFAVTLRNTGDEVLRFLVQHDIVSEPGRLFDRHNGGGMPQRDNPGDILQEFTPPGGAASHYNVGLAWDEENEWMWNNDFHSGQCYALDPNNDFQPARQFAVTARCMSIALLNGHLYMVVDPQAYLTHYDRDGNQLGNVQFGYTPYAVTYSTEMELLFVMGSDGNVHLYRMNDQGQVAEEVGQIRGFLASINNRACRSMLWVDAQPDGPMWFHSTSGPNAEAGNHAWEFAVDTDNWVLGDRQQVFRTRDTGGGSAQHWDVLGHDGENLWASYWAIPTIRIMDDGVVELTWLSYDPREGALEAGGEMDVFITINAAGLIGGDYEADLIFVPAEGEWEAVSVSVFLEVTPAGDINAKWAPAIGYPDLVDFNREGGYRDQVFTGAEYTLPITVYNVGVEDLAVDDIDTGHDYFTAAPTEFVLAPREHQAVDITFQAPAGEAGEVETDMVIFSNDPNEGEYAIHLHAQAWNPPIIVVEPNAIDVDLNWDNNGHAEEVLNIANQGDAVLRFVLSYDIISEGQRDGAERDVSSVRNGPSRDEPGDLIATINGINAANNYTHAAGYDWDNEWMWFTSYTSSFVRAYSFDDDYQNVNQELNIALQNPMDGAWLNGIFFTSTYNNATLQRFDAEGNNLGQTNLGVATTGYGADVEEGLLFTMDQAAPQNIHVYPVDDDGALGNQIGLINNHVQYHNNVAVYTMEWVAKHPDGQLWITDGNGGNVYQISVDTDQWQATGRVQSFRVGSTQAYDPVAHDGHNLWCSDYTSAEVRIYDDGVQELYWLSYDISEGELQPNEDVDVILTLDAAGCFGGEYEADLYVDSNDPETPRVTVTVHATITGIPDITVEWPDNCGFPNNMDWNRAYQDIFVGAPYNIDFVISNDGTDDLVVEDITTNHEYFTTNFADELVLAPRESVELAAIFEASEDNPGEFEGELTILSNDPDEGHITIPLHAAAAGLPHITVAPDAIDEALVTGETAEVVLTLGNDGDALLRWEITHEIISEPGNDRAARDIRDVPEAELHGPARDNPGDVLNRWTWNRAPVNFYKGGIAIDVENQIMFLAAKALVDPAIRPISRMGLIRLGEEFEVIREWDAANVNAFGAAYLNGVFYNLHYPTNVNPGTFLNRWDEEGNDIGNMNLEFRPTSLTASQELGVLLITDDSNRNIVVLTPDGEQVGTIARDDYVELIGNRDQRSICWVDAHRNGHLWVNTPGRLYQLDVNPRNWEVGEQTQNFAWAGNNEWDGVGHDGENLWLGGANQAQYLNVDDGTSEAAWLVYEPSSGELEPDAESDVFVTLDAAGLIEGEYVAEMTIAHNVPVQDPVVIPVCLEVTGVPLIEVTWNQAYGFPDLIDWNRAYADLFTGSAYDMTFVIENIGTSDLAVDDIESGHQYFSAAPSEFVLSAGERQVVTVTFECPADAPDDYTTNLTIFSNAHENEEVTLTLHALADQPPILIIEPNALEGDLLTGQVDEQALNLTNDGDALLRFTVRHEIISEPGRDAQVRDVRRVANGGPQRDNLGDIIAQFNGPQVANQYWSPIGWDPDNEIMYITGYNANSVVEYTHSNYEDFREVRRFATPNPMDGAWFNGVIYVCNLNANTVLRRYDVEGNNLGDLAMGYATYGLAFDRENNWMFAREQAGAYPIHVYRMDGIDRGEEIGRITNYLAFNNNVNPYAIEWVSKHPDGQLWLPQNPNLNQIHVDTDNWQCTGRVASFAAVVSQPYDAATHDGYNMWMGGYSSVNFRIYDDGVVEVYWLGYDPREGEIQGHNDMDLIVTLDASGLVGGDYEGEIHILSNDPAQPDAAVSVTLTVTAAPNIAVDWDDDYGAPDFVDWNAAHIDLFAGQEYPMILTVGNDGVEDMLLSDARSDDEHFRAVLQDEIVIAPREKIELMVNFATAADEAGVYEATLTLLSNDPDQQEYPVNLRAQAFNPPIIRITPNHVHSFLMENETEERGLTVANIGEANLRFKVGHEIIAEPEGQRRLGQGGPHRDNPGDVLANFMPPGGAASHYNVGLAWDVENGWMWNNDFHSGQCYALNPADNFQPARQFAVTARCMSIGLLNGHLYMVVDPQSYLTHYDRDGNNLGNVQLAFTPYAVTASADMERLFVMGSDGNVHIYQMNEEGQIAQEAGVIRSFLASINNRACRSMLWVDLHPEGPLWFHSTSGPNAEAGNYAWEFAVDTDNWILGERQQVFRTRDTGGGAAQHWDVLGHDGDNLWASYWAISTILILDDGIHEIHWLSYSPRKGELESGEDAAVQLIFDSEDLIDGDYEANLLFESNDPVNPNVAVPVMLTVGLNPLVHYGPDIEEPFVETETYHTLLIEDLTLDNQPLPSNWGEIGVFTPDDVLSGAAVWFDRGVELKAYGAAAGVPQFQNGDAFHFRIWDREADMEYNASAIFIDGPRVWSSGAQSNLTLAGRSLVQQRIHLIHGWNMISLNIDPIDFYAQNENRGPDIPLMFAQLEDEEGNQNIDLLKDEMGHFWAPAWVFINIPYWELTDGYQVKVFNDCVVMLEGNPIAADADIPINPNWNLIAYFPNYDLVATAESDFYVLSPIIDHVQIAKNNEGHFLAPEWHFSNMEPWTTGQGYQVKSTAGERIILNYPQQQRQLAYSEPSKEQTGCWTAPLATGANMSVLVNSIDGTQPGEGDQLAAFSASNVLLGVGDVVNGRCGLALWGDDPTTEAVDGANDGEAFTLKLWDADRQVVRDLEVTMIYAGEAVYKTDDFVALDVRVRSAVPDDYYLAGAYPNPFNNVARLTFGLPEAGQVKLSVYDVNGRLIANLVNAQMPAGHHVYAWDAKAAAAGVYVIRMESGRFTKAQKVMLLK